MTYRRKLTYTRQSMVSVFISPNLLDTMEGVHGGIEAKTVVLEWAL